MGSCSRRSPARLKAHAGPAKITKRQPSNTPHSLGFNFLLSVLKKTKRPPIPPLKALLLFQISLLSVSLGCAAVTQWESPLVYPSRAAGPSRQAPGPWLGDLGPRGRPSLGSPPTSLPDSWFPETSTANSLSSKFSYWGVYCSLVV